MKNDDDLFPQKMRKAFAQASEELGEIEIIWKQGHATGISIGDTLASRYAALGTKNWIWEKFTTYSPIYRFFPNQLVLRAAEIAELKIIKNTVKFPMLYIGITYIFIYVCIY